MPYKGVCTAQNDYDFHACREELRLLKECCKTKRGELCLHILNCLVKNSLFAAWRGALRRWI